MLDKCGKYLGEGFRRIVYEHVDDPTVVIKFLKNMEDNHNRFEFENWEMMSDTPKGLILAPCVSISEDGRFLIQKKVTILDEAPENVPEWVKVLGDWEIGGNQSKHWGMFEGKLVLVDYGDKILWNL